MKYLNIEGIKCDSCDYEDGDVSWGDSPMHIMSSGRFWLTQDCPVCGAPLLTKNDYWSLVMIIRTLQIMTPFTRLAEWRGKKLTSLHVETDGTGNTTIKEKTEDG